MALGFVQCLEILVPRDSHGRLPMILRVCHTWVTETMLSRL